MIKLKNKTLFAGFWNLFERSYNQLIRFVLNIILARLLFPEDYGLIGMITIFLAVSQSFIEGGFMNALIQKQERNENDFSTAFYFNLFVSISFYLLFFIIAPWISKFYNEPRLTLIMRVATLSIIFNSFSIVPISKLSIKLDFKRKAKASSWAMTISGIISIGLAYFGFGVWALVIQSLSLALFNSIFLFLTVLWIPKMKFSTSNFKDLFGFGSKLIIANLIDRIFRNIYYLIIGKFFSISQLGYYTRAENFSQLPATNIAGLIQSVTFPTMCRIQDNINILRINYIRNIKIASFISFPPLLFLSFFSKPIILVTLTDKWADVAPLLTLLSIVGLIYPINFLNMNLLLAKKRSDLYLKLEFIKKTLIIIMLCITVSLGINAIIYGQIIVAIFSLYINSYYTKKIIDYGVIKQLIDIIPFLMLSFIIILFSYYISSFFLVNHLKILIGFFISALLYLSTIFLTNFKNMRSELGAILN